MKRFFPAVFLAVMICGCSEEKRELPVAERLIGTWHLERVGTQPAASLALKEWEVTFNQDRTWRYRGELAGALGGMHVDGAGNWHIQQNTLVYTAGVGGGASVIAIHGNELTITPDPVLVEPRTKRPVTTTYRRRPFA
ncbi:MAG TPA: hypothetical protein VF219_08530 [Vicinamibacterales bacterium]